MTMIVLPLALLAAAPGQAGSNAGLQLAPEPLVAFGPLQARLDGPFGQPAPTMALRIEPGRIIVQTSSLDYVDPHLPTVPFVTVAGAAPAAGTYELLDVRCTGNPPPPLPGCTVAAQGVVQVVDAVQVPAGGRGVLALLASALLLVALRHLAGRAPD